ncbi:MAG TPA: hypothetical protein PLC42_01860 [Parachlamydiaceae bacterium]|nr:hypothetical protein [Parachlamydiaceae bacterium]
MISNRTFLAVEKALQDGAFFLMTPSNTIRVEKFNFIEQIFRHCTTKRQQAPIQNAVWFKDQLIDAPQQKSEAFDPERLVDTIRMFLNQYKKYKDEPEFRACALELLAYRLKIPSKALDEAVNPGFKDFAEKSHLYNYLATHNDKLVVMEDHKIKMQFSGNLSPWEFIKQEVENYLKETKNYAEPYTISLYGRLGIENRNRCNWTKLLPFLKSNTKEWAPHFLKNLPIFNCYNKAYAIEFCSTATEKLPRKVGDHTFVRLYSFVQSEEETYGKMYSFGLYRPHKEGCQSGSDALLKIKPGFINEEVSEVWGINDKIRTIALQITKEQFSNIKNKVRQDKEKNEIIFQLFSFNCDQYASDLALLADVTLPTKRHFFELLVISFEEEKFKDSNQYVQTAAKIANLFLKVFLFLCTPLFNLILLYLGAGQVDSRVKGSSKPIISCFSDLFDSKTLYPSSPWVLGTAVKKEVEEWRAREIAKLDLTKEGDQKIRDTILFSFPPHYKAV